MDGMEITEANNIIQHLQRGQRLLIGEDGEESYWLLSIDYGSDGRFNVKLYEGLLYDVVAPTKYTDKILSEIEAREFLCNYGYQQALAGLRAPSN